MAGGALEERINMVRSAYAAHFLKADVSLESDVERCVNHALARYGRVDPLVNNKAIHYSLHFWRQLLRFGRRL
ncbi:MAG: SDR family oxidoreductase [Nitrososphaerota archaeon]|nr:SDR family oxidoreductase [Candidatus Calditenuaceae archaeon]MDW8073104.1 SDR family oxidoreductase [Nitrososphaerota archaeon]